MTHGEVPVIPGSVLLLIQDTPGAELPGTTTDQHTCQGAKYHSPTPMIVRPLQLGGEIVYLCGTCTDNVQVLASLLRGRQGDVPWPVRRCFGNLVRGVAGEVYAHSVKEQTHA